MSARKTPPPGREEPGRRRSNTDGTSASAMGRQRATSLLVPELRSVGWLPWARRTTVERAMVLLVLRLGMKRRDLSFHLRGAALQEHQLKAEQITYPPLDVPKPVTASVWIVDSGPTKAMGVIPLPIRITIIRLQDGSLMLHSPTRYNSTLRRSLEEFGAINHIMRQIARTGCSSSSGRSIVPRSRHGARRASRSDGR